MAVFDSAGQPVSPDEDSPEDSVAAARRKRRRRVNILLASAAVFVMLAGIGLVAGTYYVDKVELPEELYNLQQSTKVYYADGATEMARLGDENRTNINIKDVKKYVQDAVVATEDNSFYTNNGVDYRGIIRAAWNNVTGGDRQGASTITQQYARHIAELKDISYGRKVREAVLATKLKQQYTNDEIMEMYLNTVYFGRQAYGIEAASKAYLNKSAKDLSVGEAMALTAMIKQPVMDATGAPGPYDLSAHPETAKPRFDYVRNKMVELEFMTQQEAAAIPYPELVPYDPSNVSIISSEWGKDKPTWLAVHHVMDELVNATSADGTPVFGKTPQEFAKTIRNAGLKIVTTIDPKMQKIAEEVADPNGAFFKKLGFKNPELLQSGLVAVEPGTGRVRAYYGGSDGTGTDYAGFYRDPVFTDTSLKISARPPGSTMKIYTAMAGLMAGYSIESTWDATQKVIEGRKTPVTNAAKANCAQGETSCKLWEAIRDSTNVPFVALTAQKDVRPAKVRDAARAAGVRVMEATVEGEGAVNVNLNSEEQVDKYGDAFGVEIGIGQYPITVLDHANGTATLAAQGMAAEAHFVQDVFKGEDRIMTERLSPKKIPNFTKAMADDLCYAMQEVTKVSNLTLDGGRSAASKSGTWQHPENEKWNADAWYVGFTGRDTNKDIPGLASAVWLGTKGKDKQVRLQFARGGEVYGAKGAGPIWREFMNRALKGTPKAKLASKIIGVGDKEIGTGKAPKINPSAPVIPGLPGGVPSWPGLPDNHGDNNQGGNNGGNNGVGGTIPEIRPSTN